MVTAVPFHNLPSAYVWLNSQIDYERRLGSIAYDRPTFALEDFRQRLQGLGLPRPGMRTIHIAGTRGKGSAALLLEALIQASGLRTAVFTSPHLREYRERIRLDGQPIAAEPFMQFLGQIAQVDRGHEASTPRTAKRGYQTVFEHLTALFLLAAGEAGVDWSIVETGLGGRLDATNVLAPGPVLLTRIGLEHTRLLGDTTGKIAGEKAAILKAGGWGIMANQDPSGEAEEVFNRRAAAVGARLERAEQLCPIRHFQPHGQGMRLELDFEGRPLTLNLGLFGDFQAENAQNALAMFSRLRRDGLIPSIADRDITAALEPLSLPGRMDRVCLQPEIFADGGHCPTAAAALARAMEQHFGRQPAGLLVGMMDDKDHAAFFRELARWPGWRALGCYRVDSPRAVAPEKLAQAAAAYFHDITVYPELNQALQSFMPRAEEWDRVIAVGSLYSIARLEEWGMSHGTTISQT